MLYLNYSYPHHKDSRMPCSENVSPFLEGGRCYDRD